MAEVARSGTLASPPARERRIIHLDDEPTDKADVDRRPPGQPASQVRTRIASLNSLVLSSKLYQGTTDSQQIVGQHADKTNIPASQPSDRGIVDGRFLRGRAKRRRRPAFAGTGAGQCAELAPQADPRHRTVHGRERD